jgi:hypothetical protein
MKTGTIPIFSFDLGSFRVYRVLESPGIFARFTANAVWKHPDEYRMRFLLL